MPVTLSDVALRAGVSLATASRVLNGRRYVATTTRQRVEEAARELDYVPNRAARNLSMARAGAVALVVHHAQYPAGGEGTFASRVLHGASEVLAAEHHDLLYTTASDADARNLIAMPALRGGRVDGMLVLGPALPRDSLRALYAAGRPLVLIDNLLDGQVDAVMAENLQAAKALTRHLIEVHRYRRIVCLAGPAAWPSTAERIAGYRAAMAAHQLRPRVVHLRETTIRHGAEGIDRLGSDLPEAVVAVNDAMAIGAMHRLRGVRDRPAVVGFDDIAWARLTDPPLTTVAIDAESMGRRAAQLLGWRLAGEAPQAPRLVREPAALRVRRSCGCEGTERTIPIESEEAIT